MATVQPGTYTVEDLLSRAGFNFAREAAADYLDGQPDYRRVTVGGLPFASLDDKINVIYNADDLEIALDGQVVDTIQVDNGAPVDEAPVATKASGRPSDEEV